MPNPDLTELGTTGLNQTSGTVTEEFLRELQGQKGIRLYTEMRDNDPLVGAILYSIEQIVKRLEWRVNGGDDRAEFVQSCLDDMSDSWDATLSSILGMLPYGWSFHEIVYKRRSGDTDDPAGKSKHSDGRIGWRKWPVRGQDTLARWVFDSDGGIQGMEQYVDGGTVTIPIEKSLLFRTTTVKGNPEGRSLLRNAVRPWMFKRRIEEFEAIGVERDLAGLPVAWLPPEYMSSTATTDQRAVFRAVQDIVSNIKRNEQEGVVFPMLFDESGHKMMDLTLLSSGGSRQFDTNEIITRYDSRIAMTVLADFLMLGHDRVGSFSLGAAKIDLWTMAVESIAQTIAEVVNSHAIPRLLKLNGLSTDDPPMLGFSDVAQVDLGDMADFIQRMTIAGVLTPDTELESWLRDVANLPELR